MNSENYRNMREKIKCLGCGGTGEVLEQRTFSKSFYRRCWYCNGTGRVTKRVDRKPDPYPKGGGYPASNSKTWVVLKWVVAVAAFFVAFWQAYHMTYNLIIAGILALAAAGIAKALAKPAIFLGVVYLILYAAYKIGGH